MLLKTFISYWNAVLDNASEFKWTLLRIFSLLSIPLYVEINPRRSLEILREGDDVMLVGGTGTQIKIFFDVDGRKVYLPYVYTGVAGSYAFIKHFFTFLYCHRFFFWAISGLTFPRSSLEEVMYTYISRFGVLMDKSFTPSSIPCDFLPSYQVVYTLDSLMESQRYRKVPFLWCRGMGVVLPACAFSRTGFEAWYRPPFCSNCISKCTGSCRAFPSALLPWRDY